MTYPEAMEKLLERTRAVLVCDDGDWVEETDYMHAVLPVLIEAIEYQYGVIGAIADHKCRDRVRHMMKVLGEKGLKAADGNA